MALSGLHITCGYASSSSHRHLGLPLLGKVVWAQTMTEAGITEHAAPSGNDTRGAPMFQVRSSVDAFVSPDPTPDASSANSKRIFVPAGERVEFYAEPGDKLAWVAA